MHSVWDEAAEFCDESAVLVSHCRSCPKKTPIRPSKRVTAPISALTHLYTGIASLIRMRRNAQLANHNKLRENYIYIDSILARIEPDFTDCQCSTGARWSSCRRSFWWPWWCRRRWWQTDVPDHCRA